jgi:hypothetical protein
MSLNRPFRPSSHIFTSHQPDPELYLSTDIPVSLFSNFQFVLDLLLSVVAYDLHDLIHSYYE